MVMWRICPPVSPLAILVLIALGISTESANAEVPSDEAILREYPLVRASDRETPCRSTETPRKRELDDANHRVTVWETLCNERVIGVAIERQVKESPFAGVSPSSVTRIEFGKYKGGSFEVRTELHESADMAAVLDMGASSRRLSSYNYYSLIDTDDRTGASAIHVTIDSFPEAAMRIFSGATKLREVRLVSGELKQEPCPQQSGGTFSNVLLEKLLLGFLYPCCVVIQ